jgi:hemerythrin-like domain-containing protein
VSASQPIEVKDMRIVHATFRRAFDESAQLVRAAPTPSAKRVTFLADHIDFGISMLHTHHESEDLLLYPLLAERVPEQAAMVNDAGHQHQEVASALGAVTDACATWRAQPGPETAEALATSLVSLNDVLQPHLDDEERKVVPLAAVTLTQEEWDAVGEHSRKDIPRSKMPVAFGMLLDPLDDDDRRYMKGHLPAPIRLLYPVLIQRPWDKYASELRTGT